MLTREQVEQYRRDGFLIVEDVFSAAQMDAALAHADLVTYGKPFAEALADVDAGKLDDAGDRHEARYGGEFPTGSLALDDLLAHDPYLDALEQLVGGKLSFNLGNLIVRFAPSDRRHYGETRVAYHIDHSNLSFLPPSDDVLHYSPLNSYIYLHDVEADMAPTMFLPGTHLDIARRIPALIAEDNWRPPGGILDLDRVADRPQAVAATGKRGSVLFFQSSVLHAAIPFENRRVQRAVWALSVSLRETHPFNKFRNIYESNRPQARAFFTRTTARARALFGWPEPGDPYYTPTTLRLLALWYPGMDLTPYERALQA